MVYFFIILVDPRFILSANSLQIFSRASCRIVLGVAQFILWNLYPSFPNIVPRSSQTFALFTMRASISESVPSISEKSSQRRYVPSGCTGFIFGQLWSKKSSANAMFS